jgi:hypothetical protein
MKRLIFSLLLVAGTLVATKSEAQVFIRGGVRFGIPVPVPRVYCAPRIVYGAPYPAPYYGGGVVVAGPAYGYGYGRGYYHGRAWRRGGRW